MDINYDFRKARKELKLTLHQVSALTGIPATTIWNLEHATHITGIKRIAQLQATYEELLKEKQNG